MTGDRLVRWWLARCMPDRLAGEAAEDLLADYRRVRHQRGRAAATIFLVREAGSLSMAFIFGSIARLPRSMVVLRRDTGHAIRVLARRPWSSLAAAVMLSAGLAAVAAASGLSSTLLFRPISSRYGSAIQRLTSADAAGRTRLVLSEVELAVIRDAVAESARLAYANLQPAVLRTADTDLQTLAEVVGGSYFDLAGLDVAVGRPLTGADAAVGAPPLAVVSDGFWRDHFGASAAALGDTIRLNGRAFTIVGVASGMSSANLLGGSVDAWITVAHADAVLDRDWRTNLERRWWTTLVHAPQAGFPVALERAAADLAARFPEDWRGRQLTLIPGTVVTGRQREAAVTLSIVLTGFAVLIFGAAAANASGLFLASAAADRGRAAIQLAIGSGRAAIVRRQLIEGAIVGAAGGAIALALYGWIRRQLAEVALLPTLSLRLDLPFDLRVMTIIFAGGALAGLVLSLAPGIWVTRLDLVQALRDGAGRASSGPGLSRARRVLVAVQVAVSVVLLAGASLFSRSLDALETLDIGFSRAGLIAMDFDLEPSAPATLMPSLAREALQRSQAVSGVTAAAMASRAPIDASTPTLSVNVPGSTSRPLADVTFYQTTERYFDTVGLPIVRGRAFTEAESLQEDNVVIVNETLAEWLWPDGDVLDRALVLHPQQRRVRVVGVARDSKYRSLSEPRRPHLYLPMAPNFGRSLLVRTGDDPHRTMRAVQAALDDVGPGVVGFFPRTADDHLAIDMLPTTAASRAASVLGALALGLSTTGLYGIVMWFVEVRRREIGVRVALGASANAVRGLVVRQAAAAAAPGLAIGLVLAIALTTLGQSLFVGIDAIDPVSLLLGAGVLAVIVAAASYVPSRRATNVDPVIVLRDS
jgi:putative ABC transport system permease protein